jgi:hypothetical protein
MARSGLAVLLIVTMLALSGCIVSTLQPFYSPETLTADDGLMGTWTDSDGEMTYTFGDNGDGGYQLFMAGKGEGQLANYVCYLAEVEGHLFLDMYPDLGDEGVPGYAPWNFAGLHNVYVVDQVRPTLQVRMLSIDWLDSFITDHPDAVAHGWLDMPDGSQDLPVLTGRTAELQQFYSAHVDTPDAFTEVLELLPAGEALQPASQP